LAIRSLSDGADDQKGEETKTARCCQTPDAKQPPSTGNRGSEGQMRRIWQYLCDLFTFADTAPSAVNQPSLVRFGRVACFAFAAANVAVALLLTRGIEPLSEQPPVLWFFVAVILTGWYAGPAAGFVASVLSMLTLYFLFVAPAESFGMELIQHGTNLLAFAVATWLVAALQYRWRNIHRELVTLERDMEIAREIQQQMFPSGPPSLPGFEVGAACFPTAATGGDFFDYIPMPNGCVGIACGDVSGHGIGAALVMALSSAYLRALARTHLDPGEILTKANQLVYDGVERGQFITLFLARLDPETKTIVCAGAGHEAQVIDASGNAVALSPTGPPLGILESIEIGHGPSVVLESGQILLLLSDGILESRSAAGEQFGLTRVLEIVKNHRQKPVQEIVTALYQAARAFGEDEVQDDDMTIVMVRVK
jgi:hypothetical protein